MAPSPEQLASSQPGRVVHWAQVAAVTVACILVVVAAVFAYLLVEFNRTASGESRFVVGLRSVNTANITYSSTYPERGFAPSLKALGGPTPCEASADHACLIDQVLASGEKSGYRYTYRAFDHDGDGVFEAYTVNAEPLDRPSGLRHFYTDQSGAIRFEVGRPAGPHSTPLQ